MSEAFRLGGWGMYPTLIAGLVLVGYSLRYAVTPDATRALIVRRLSFLTFLAGSLGFTAGVIRVLSLASALPPNELIGAVVAGVGESLHNIGLALALLVLSAIAMSVGAARRGAGAGAELADPHGP